MKSKIFITILLVIGSIVFIQSCSKKDEHCKLKHEKLVLPDSTVEYFADAISNKKATIGRVLFYDKNLSATNAIACASCHFQQNAFADGKQFSTGFAFEQTNRNSMAFNNLALQEGAGFFWDIRESQLQSMVLKPVSNHIEMGFTDINSIVKKLKQYEHYNTLFSEAYNDQITVTNVADALKTFLYSIQSNNSRFDKAANLGTTNGGIRQTNWEEDFPSFTMQENKGKKIFINSGCSNCHSPWSNFQRGWSNVANIGLEMNYKDKGAKNPNGGFIDFKVANSGSNENEVEGYFKIPSLRNVELTAPYMHDGRFATLYDVLNHYSEGIKNHKDLSWELKTFDASQSNASPKRFNYTEEEKQSLIAFLKTLTDNEMVRDVRFSNPFCVVD